MSPNIDVCVATYKRPKPLRQLLLSLAAQVTNGEFCFAIIVADNDAQRSAEPIVREFVLAGQPIIYSVEPEQNISLARNKALSFATGNYIALIDDDEYADPRWLLHLYRAITFYNAEVVHGPVVSEFSSEIPDYIRAGFTRPNPPTGSTERYIFYTGNTMFRRELIEGVSMPFDRRFGRTGSEDMAFFYRLKRNGRRMIWVRDAVAFEPVSSQRANLVSLLKRRFRNGNLYPSWHEYSYLTHGAQIGFSSLQILRLACIMLFYLAGAIVDPKNRTRGIKCLCDIAFRVGILAHYANVRVGNREDQVS